ncbi:MAG: GNAT family N-acetyltransferase [Acidimicrobiia bacterium]
MDIRELTALEELEQAVEVQAVVWGIPPAETVPVHLLVAARHAGGLVAGAWEGQQLVGLVFGIASWLRGAAGHHSHMLAVLPSHQGRGIGERLKWYQRRWCLERGITMVRWTFDPLQAGNAHLNFNKLGSTASEYLTDAYGPLRGPLNEGVPSDRLVVEWDLQSPRVRAAARGVRPPPIETGPLVTPTAEGPPSEVIESDAPAVRIAVPASFSHLPIDDPASARAWRLVARAALQHYLQRGYRAEAFLRQPTPALVLRRLRSDRFRPDRAC